MDLLKDNVGKLYRHFLAAAFGSALITSIYGLVDMAMVGQYHGPTGTAAMSVIAPVWNVIYSLGLLTGIGGSVLFSVRRGEQNKQNNANLYFTNAVWLTAVFAVLCYIVMWRFEVPVLRLFGANDELLPLAVRYLSSVRFVVPSFMFMQLLSAFLRNDSAPGLSTKAVIIGGIFNVFGDYFFVFTLDMGITGAGLATSVGSVISLLIMCTHFLSKKCTLRLVAPKQVLSSWKSIVTTGFSAFFIDVAMGILTMLFNRQIMQYLGTDALAVYGIIVNISTFVQCCAYGVGQASQPILSQNYGAGQYRRIHTLLGYNLASLGVLSVVWIVLMMAVPNLWIRLFMAPTASVLAIAPFIIRSYATSFPFLLLNVYSTYYFQSILKPGLSFIISVARGLVISGSLILLLPRIAPAESLWFAMTITETLVAVFVGWQMFKTDRKLQ